MVDFVIVGAGSAGCVLANRLSADPSVKVTLLEAGGKDRNFLYHMPAGLLGLMRSGKGNWNYESVPQPGLNNRSVYFPRGKVLGGSSSINGLVVSRGNAGDYDHWAQLGNQGWSYADCLPYFKKLEDFPGGDPAYRGTGGPIGVTLNPPPEQMSPIARAWIEGGLQAGFPFNKDVNALWHGADAGEFRQRRAPQRRRWLFEARTFAPEFTDHHRRAGQARGDEGRPRHWC